MNQSLDQTIARLIGQVPIAFPEVDPPQRVRLAAPSSFPYAAAIQPLDPDDAKLAPILTHDIQGSRIPQSALGPPDIQAAPSSSFNPNQFSTVFPPSLHGASDRQFSASASRYGSHNSTLNQSNLFSPNPPPSAAFPHSQFADGRSAAFPSSHFQADATLPMGLSAQHRASHATPMSPISQWDAPSLRAVRHYQSNDDF